MTKRDEFLASTIRLLGDRVRWLCSRPDCRRVTIGPQKSGKGVVRTGVAAHITAATARGPRFDPSLSSEERRSYDNGIWLCSDHAHQIDHDEQYFTVDMLRSWKKQAVDYAYQSWSSPDTLPVDLVRQAVAEEISLLDKYQNANVEIDIDSLRDKTVLASSVLARTFRNLPTWPVHSIPLNISPVDTQLSQEFDVVGLARALDVAREITIISPPGTGKTTTLVQLAEELLKSGVVAVIIPLSEWSASNSGLFDWIVSTKEFDGIEPKHLQRLAGAGELTLLLDGWNELDATARSRLISQITGLKREYDLLKICISTRRQSLDAPVNGRQVRILDLSRTQQEEIAKAKGGDSAVNLLDRAWRTPGLRDLVAIPLYLNATLEISPDGVLPDTKEELISRFFDKHEESPERREKLEKVLEGHHRQYLEALSVEATKAAVTNLPAAHANRAVSAVGDHLVRDGQLAERQSPKAVIDILTNCLLLQRDEKGDISFQHQQFQEWFASLEVERRILELCGETLPISHPFCVEVINIPAWEEPLLFACERLSQSDDSGRDAVANVVHTCLAIDPYLAATIIARTDESVWQKTQAKVLSFADEWYKVRQDTRAIGFMIATGRSEFADRVWDCIGSDNREVHFDVFRTAGGFNPSVLGTDVDAKLSSLCDDSRASMLSELVYWGGIDGIEMASELAANDKSSEVKYRVVQSLIFRKADRHATRVMGTADDDVWQRICLDGYSQDTEDPELLEQIQQRLDWAWEQEANPSRKISALVNLPDILDRQQRLFKMISSEEFNAEDREAGWLLHRAFDAEPTTVSIAIRERLLTGKSIPWEADIYLSELDVEDSQEVQEIVTRGDEQDKRALSAACLIGPAVLREILQAHLERAERHSDGSAPLKEKDYKVFRHNEDIIQATRFSVFLEVIGDYAAEASKYKVAKILHLLARRSDGSERIDISDPEKAKVVDLIGFWARNLLKNDLVNRHDLSEAARAIEAFPDVSLLDLASELVVTDLSRREAARQEMVKSAGRSDRSGEASISYGNTYRNMLVNIGGASVEDLLVKLLRNPLFEEDAAYGLCKLWSVGVESYLGSTTRNRSWPDYRLANENRARIGSEPDQTTRAAEEIFNVSIELWQEGTKQSKSRVVNLASIPAIIPHGDKNSYFEELLSSDVSLRLRQKLCQRMLVGGLTIKSDLLIASLKQLFEDAETKPWLLHDDALEIHNWLELFPHSDKPMSLLDAVELSFQAIDYPGWRIRELIYSIRHCKDVGVELLSSLALKHPSLWLGHHEFYRALLDFDPRDSLGILLDVMAIEDGSFVKLRQAGLMFPAEFARLLFENRENLEACHNRYKQEPPGAIKGFLGSVLLYSYDHEIVLAVISEPFGREVFAQTPMMNMSELIHRKEPHSQDSNVYSLIPIDASRLRSGLFDMFINGDEDEKAFARKSLEVIDHYRSERGFVDTEPRHPSIGYGLPWPDFPDMGDNA